MIGRTQSGTRAASKRQRLAGWVLFGSLAALAVMPASGAAATLNWSAPMNIDGSNRIDSLDCPSSTLCVAGDALGHILSSTNPGGGSGAWASNNADVGEGHDLLSFSCPSITLCVGVDYFGDALSSANPSGGAGSWHSTGRLEVALVGVSCPTTSFCAASQQDGDLFYSTEPAAQVWQNSGSISGFGLSEKTLSCPSSALCVVGDSAGDVLTSSNPSGGAAAWHATSVDPEISAINCPSTSFCAAVDSEGNVLTTTNPTGGTWAKHKIASEELRAIECSSASFCVASDGNGNLLETNEPTGSAASWTTISGVVAGGFIGNLSCPSASFCVGVDDIGNAYVASSSIQPRHLLTISKAGLGEGTVVSSPAGINCGPVCAHEFAGSTTVTLTASPNPEESFEGWSGGGCSGAGTCQVTISAATEVTAHFGATPIAGGTPPVGGPPATVAPNPTPKSAAPPSTKLGSHPAAKVFTKSALATTTFRFSSDVAGASFKCKLDKGAFRACRSPKTYKVKPGKHVFQVEAVSAAGTDASPAIYRFTVARRR